ncbi:MAG: tetratricopeptide repeat protein [Thiomicrorhabdus sp.]|nr:tetratricopeptide repeat protein [Thiomicrorhabdus sp.]
MFELDDNSPEAKAIFSFGDLGGLAYEKEDFESAIQFYQKAWDAIPEPKKEWDLAHWIMNSIGEGFYDLGKLDQAIEYLKEALTCYRGDVDSRINFSLGRAYYDKDSIEQATLFLQTAWDLSEGRAFQDEDSKYLYFLKK